MSWGQAVLDGLVSFFNKVLLGGAFGKAIFGVVFTWLVGVAIAGISGLIGTLAAMTPLGNLLSDGALSVGNVGAIGLWLWSLFGAGVYLALAGLAIRFIIRRIPVVG
jgi:hypothetical protein